MRLNSMTPWGPYEFGLPVRLRDLPALLSGELDPARPRGLRVTSVQGEPGPELLLLLDVVAEARGDSGVQVWRLAYEVPPEDLAALDASSFVLTLRANLEEWWDTGRDSIPGLEAVRLS